MPFSVDQNMRVAESILRHYGAQADLLLTLALGICGGVVALTMQLAFHNRDRSKVPLHVRRRYLVLLCYVAEGVSIVFGYFARGALVSLTATIYRQDFSSVTNWTDHTFEGSYALRGTALVQFVFFLLGVVLVLVFFLGNLKSLGGPGNEEGAKSV